MHVREDLQGVVVAKEPGVCMGLKLRVTVARRQSLFYLRSQSFKEDVIAPTLNDCDFFYPPCTRWPPCSDREIAGLGTHLAAR